jgi:hypothetical protein
MDKPAKERRAMSQTGLLDSAMRMVAQLANSSDPNVRTLASRALADIQRARHLTPARRTQDKAPRVA